MLLQLSPCPDIALFPSPVKTLLYLSIFRKGEVELTHEGTEGDDGQQTLDQHPEPVGQGSVIAAVRIRLIDLRHVGDIRDVAVQKPPLQEEPAVKIHGKAMKTTTTQTKGGITWVSFDPHRLKKHNISTFADRLM